MPPFAHFCSPAPPQDTIEAAGATIEECDRGGNVTFHGPGQLVGYPIMHLRQLRCKEAKPGVRWYVDTLEKSLIAAAARCDITAMGERKGETGVWVEDRKLGAIGVRVQRWVTCHGFALNVNTDLSFFDYIVPCGLSWAREVTSISKEVEREMPVSEFAPHMVHAFGECFGVEMRDAPQTFQSEISDMLAVWSSSDAVGVESNARP